jgi:uncharacterized protein (DUF1778 family)
MNEIIIELSDTELDMIKQAIVWANYKDINEFAVNVINHEAKKLFKKIDHTILDNKSFEKFVTVCESPRSPSDSLKKYFMRVRNIDES